VRVASGTAASYHIGQPSPDQRTPPSAAIRAQVPSRQVRSRLESRNVALRSLIVLTGLGTVLAACGQSIATTGRPELFVGFSSNFSSDAHGARSSPPFQVTAAGDYLIDTTFTSLDCPLYSRQDGEQLVGAEGTVVQVPGAANVRVYLPAGTWRVALPYESTARCVEAVVVSWP
jgi:hypothetical protein